MTSVFLVVLLATILHSVAGFGFALVSMPLLVITIGIEQAAPLVSLIGIGSIAILVIRYRTQVQLSSILGLVIGSLVGIPLGVLALRTVNEPVIVFLLGAIVLGYALYALFSPQLPSLEKEVWGYGFGFLAGLIGGAYNSGGPPLVIYGNSKSWAPKVFKGNMQILLLIHGVTISVSHAYAGNYTMDVLELCVISVPAVLLGSFIGYVLDRYINDRLFNQLVLLLLIVLGMQLILSAIK